MKKLAMVLGGVFLLLAAVVFVFASGLRRWYAGLFFAFIGIATLLNASMRGGATEE